MTAATAAAPHEVLLVEDDEHVRLGCSQALRLAGLAVRGVGSAEEAFEVLASPETIAAVVTDMRLPKADGLHLVQRLQALDRTLPAIMITGHGDVALAVEAMRSGAYDFIEKPFSPERLVDVVNRALERRRLSQEVATLRGRLAGREGLEATMLGGSDAIRAARTLLLTLCEWPVDVLLSGETGTGKEVAARALHDHSRRRDAPFVALNCGGLPDTLLDSELFGHEAGSFTGATRRRVGKIEHASGGTLFLDEVESMPLGLQVKLLRVLQERRIERLGSNTEVPIDVRVVAATKVDLLGRAQEGTFRTDLYYRLAVASIALPPLRERREDVPLLFEHFALLASKRFGRPVPELDAARRRRLVAHGWPGNVRELRNVADCAVLGIPEPVLGPGPEPRADADEPVGLPLADAVDAYERELIRAALQQHGGRVEASARALRVPKTTLADKIRKHRLQRSEADAAVPGERD
jgi:DNA-binding NtrC family response regulator